MMNYRQMAERAQEAAALPGLQGPPDLCRDLLTIAGRLRTLHYGSEEGREAYHAPTQDPMAMAHRQAYIQIEERRKLRDAVVAFMATPACDDRLRLVLEELDRSLRQRNAQTVAAWD